MTEKPTTILLPETTFSEITHAQRSCKLCQLVRLNPSVLFVVHELFRKGIKGRALVKKIGPIFAEAGEEMPARPAFLNHLRAHCSWPGVPARPKKVKKELPLVPSIALMPAPETHAAIAATTAFRSDAVDAETDYIELRKLYEDFRTIFTDVKKKFHLESAKDGKQEGDAKPPSDYALVMLVKLAGELRQMLKTLSDMRNSEKLFSLVLLRHTESLVSLLTEPLGERLRDVRDQLTSGADPQIVAARLDRLLGGEIYPLFETAATRAIEESRQRYRLH